MDRTFAELIRDYETDPSRWEVVLSETSPSSNRRNRGGSSVQELLRNTVTGEEIVRHRLLKPDGTPFAEAHFRPKMKKPRDS